MKHASLKERFDEKWMPEPYSGCWLWTGVSLPQGYGKMTLNHKTLRSNRVSWELHRGTIPTGMMVLHKCDTPSCVNPDHLFLGTSQDNHDDCTIKNRKAKGENHGRAKLTKEQVQLILESELSQRRLAKVFGVHQTTVSLIQRRKKWRHIQ